MHTRYVTAIEDTDTVRSMNADKTKQSDVSIGNRHQNVVYHGLDLRSSTFTTAAYHVCYSLYFSNSDTRDFLERKIQFSYPQL